MHILIIKNVDGWALNHIIWSIYFLWGKKQAHWHSITLFWHNDLLPPPVTWTTHNTVHDKCSVNQSTTTQIHSFQTQSHNKTLNRNQDDHMQKQSRQWWTSGIALLILSTIFEFCSSQATCAVMLNHLGATANLLVQECDREKAYSSHNRLLWGQGGLKVSDLEKIGLMLSKPSARDAWAKAKQL